MHLHSATFSSPHFEQPLHGAMPVADPEKPATHAAGGGQCQINTGMAAAEEEEAAAPVVRTPCPR